MTYVVEPNYYRETSEEIYHHGVKGMKWGVRRYQNADGSLTAAGKSRYNANYTEEQRKRDSEAYGKKSVDRINESLNNGQTIVEARSTESNRLNQTRGKARYNQSVASAVGLLAGGALGAALAVKFDSVPPQYLMTGTAMATATISAYGAQIVTMTANGYSPKQYM